MAGRRKKLDPRQTTLRSFFTPKPSQSTQAGHAHGALPSPLTRPPVTTNSSLPNPTPARPSKKRKIQDPPFIDLTDEDETPARNAKPSLAERDKPAQALTQHRAAPSFKLPLSQPRLSDGNFHYNANEAVAGRSEQESTHEDLDLDTAAKMDLTQSETISCEALAGDIDAVQDDDQGDLTDVDANTAISTSNATPDINEATFETQTGKLKAKLNETTAHVKLMEPLQVFLDNQLKGYQPDRFPNKPFIDEYLGFRFKCPTLMRLCRPIIDKLAEFCERNPDWKLENFVTPSGTIDCAMMSMAHFPTYNTKHRARGTTADVTNQCMRLFDQAVQGMDRILIFDRVPQRLQRTAAADVPEMMMPYELYKILSTLWEDIWKASKARTAILLGKLQAKNYEQRFPSSTKITLYDEKFYGSKYHMFIEWVPNCKPKIVNRLVFVVYHMESWIRHIWPQTILGIKESMASALVIAYPGWSIGRTWNIPMKPLVSAERLVRAVERASIIAVKDTSAPKPAAKTTMQTPHVNRGMISREVFSFTIRLLGLEQRTGVMLNISDVPDSILSWTLPQYLEKVPQACHHAAATLTRAFYGMDGDNNELRDHLFLLTEPEKIVICHPHAKIFTSVLWPALVRMSRQFSIQTHTDTRAYINATLQSVTGRPVMKRLLELTAEDHLGAVTATFEYKKVNALPYRILDVGTPRDVINFLKDYESYDDINALLKNRKWRRQEFDKKHGRKPFDPLNLLWVPDASKQATEILDQYVRGKYRYGTTLQEWYTIQISKYASPLKAAAKKVLTDDLNLAKTDMSAWETRVLSRVLAVHWNLLPRRYEPRWATTVGTVDIAVRDRVK